MTVGAMVGSSVGVTVGGAVHTVGVSVCCATIAMLPDAPLKHRSLKRRCTSGRGVRMSGMRS